MADRGRGVLRQGGGSGGGESSETGRGWGRQAEEF